MAGLRFPFSDLVNETETFSVLAKDFLNPGTTWTLDQLKKSLCNISRAKEDAVFRLKLKPLWTIPSNGKYEARGRKGSRDVYAIISGDWDLRPLGRKSQNRTAEFCGVASTRIELYESDNPGTRLAMWRLEWGDENSPGCYVHAQILGDTDEPPFPESVPIPRLPSIFVTPMSAVEFALGELFQDDWPKVTAGNTHHPLYWRTRQKELLLSLFSWYKFHLENRSDKSPWMTLKDVKPNGELFVEE